VRPEGLCQMKNSSGTIMNRTRDLPAVAQCLNQLRHRVPLICIICNIIYVLHAIYRISNTYNIS
jgi:hypothetical protein